MAEADVARPAHTDPSFEHEDISAFVEQLVLALRSAKDAWQRDELFVQFAVQACRPQRKEAFNNPARLAKFLQDAATFACAQAGTSVPSNLPNLLACFGFGAVAYERSERFERDQEELLQEKGARDWPPPVNLFERLAVPDFPFAALPKITREFAESMGRARGVAPAAIACATFAADSITIPRQYVISASAGQAQYTQCNFWIIVIASVSVGKSAGTEPARAPLQAIDAQTDKDHGARMSAAKTAVQVAGKPPIQLPKRPHRYTYTDATAEGLEKELQHQRGVLLCPGEVQSFLGQLEGKNAGKAGNAQRGFMLTTHYDGEPSRNARAGIDHERSSPGIAGSILSTVQFDLLHELRPFMTSDGLLQRFKFSVAEKAERDKTVDVRASEAAYAERTKFFIGRELSEKRFTLDDAAYGLWDAFRERLSTQAELLTEFDSALSGAVMKLAKHSLQLALLLHLQEWYQDCRDNPGFENNNADPSSLGPPLQIGPEIMRRAIRIADYFRDTDIAVYVNASLDAPHIKVAAWIVSLPPAKAHRIRPADIKHSVKATDALNELQLEQRVFGPLRIAGWLKPEDPESRKFAQPHFVNPKLRDMFVAIGRAERKRREEGRAMILARVGKAETGA